METTCLRLLQQNNLALMKREARPGIVVGVLASADYANVLEGSFCVSVEHASMRCVVRLASAKYSCDKCELCRVFCNLRLVSLLVVVGTI